MCNLYVSYSAELCLNTSRSDWSSEPPCISGESPFPGFPTAPLQTRQGFSLPHHAADSVLISGTCVSGTVGHGRHTPPAPGAGLSPQFEFGRWPMAGADCKDRPLNTRWFTPGTVCPVPRKKTRMPVIGARGALGLACPRPDNRPDCTGNNKKCYTDSDPRVIGKAAESIPLSTGFRAFCGTSFNLRRSRFFSTEDPARWPDS